MTALMLASPSGQGWPSLTTIGTGQVERAALAACWERTSSLHLLQLQAPATSSKSWGAAVLCQSACSHGFLASSTARELSDACLGQRLQVHKPESRPFRAWPEPSGGHGPSGLRS